MTNKYLVWIFTLLLLVVGFLLGRWYGLKQGVDVGYKQARAAAIVAQQRAAYLAYYQAQAAAAAAAAAPAIAAEAATQAGLQKAAEAANPLLVENPLAKLNIKNPLR